MRSLFAAAALFHFFVMHSNAQEPVRDSTLQEIVVQAYTADRPPEDVAVSIGYLRPGDLARFNNTSLLPAVNTIPGVRMEERSPGSYRFSIRGSSLRSPFGIRNVKMYWNGLSLTDGGGNTYLNLIDLENTGSVEVIKGPGGSLYGAGTGGVVLLRSPDVKDDRLIASASAGSFGLRRLSLAGSLHSEKFKARASIAHQQADGYRAQSAMERSAFNLDIESAIDSKNALSASVFYTDLYYETPGGLTLAQFEDDPSQARPAGGPFGSAEDQKASVQNKTIFGGISHHYNWNERSHTTSSLFASFVGFQNPSIREFEIRDETNFGARSVTKYVISDRINFSGGAEYQLLDSPIKKYANNGGVKGDQTNDDVLVSSSTLLFAQGELEPGQDWIITAGLSANFGFVWFDSSFPDQVHERRKFSAVLSPRLSLLKNFGQVSAYASFSNGFSPPTLADLYPSTATFDKSLEPERGDNLEVGLKAKFLSERMHLDLSVYDLRLRNTIVPRRDAADAEYFVNAGKTDQRGIEIRADYQVHQPDNLFSDVRIASGYSYNHYRFKNYVQGTNQGTVDHSGNKLTGVPPTVAFLAIDVSVRRKLYFKLTTNYVDHIPLNDANSIYAKPYVLVGARAGFDFDSRGKRALEVFAGVDNATDETYSLGNDLNALGGRYFNAASPRNFYIGFRSDLFFRR
jgi:iron complex outermembrane recepter protein